MTTLEKEKEDAPAGGPVQRFIRVLGPGLITGASDDDPSGIGTYSQAGAQFGFGIGWTMLVTYPLMVAIQEISARIGRTTGHGISGNLCRHYPPSLLYAIVALLFLANTINVGAVPSFTKLHELEITRRHGCSSLISHPSRGKKPVPITATRVKFTGKIARRYATINPPSMDITESQLVSGFDSGSRCRDLGSSFSLEACHHDPDWSH